MFLQFPDLFQVEIRQKIRVDGEVNRARCMPQKPTLVGAKTSGCEVFLFDYAKHAATPQTSECDPDLRLVGHDKEGYGLSWSPFKEGYLLSGSQDKKICLWDVSATPQDKVLNAMFVYEVSGAVQLVSFSCFQKMGFAVSDLLFLFCFRDMKVLSQMYHGT